MSALNNRGLFWKCVSSSVRGLSCLAYKLRQSCETAFKRTSLIKLWTTKKGN